MGCGVDGDGGKCIRPRHVHLSLGGSFDLGYADALGIADPGTRLWAMNATKAVEGIYLAAAKPAER